MLRKKTMLVSLILLTALSGCDEPLPPSSNTATDAGTKSDSSSEDDATKRKAEALAGKVKKASFPSTEVKKTDNAKAFVYLAASSDKDDVVLAALRAMKVTHTSYAKAKSKALVDDAYHKALLAKLDDGNAKIQAAAIAAAVHSIGGDKPSADVTDKLVALGSNHPKPEGKLAVLDQLWSAKGIGKSKNRMAPYIAALDAKEAWLVSSALFRLSSKAASYPDQDGLRGKVEALLKHNDPGVRGRAAEVLAALAGQDKAKKEAAGKLLIPLLGDENPFTKSAACSALARLKYGPAVHEIIKLVHDQTKNTYEIKGYKKLDGAAGWTHHDGSAWSVVSDAALKSLQSLSSMTKGNPFDFKVNSTSVQEDLKAAAEEAMAWYGKVRGDFPR